MVDTQAESPIDERLRTLAQIRMLRDKYRRGRDAMLSELHASNSWTINEKNMGVTQERIAETEKEIKQMATDTFVLTGDKNPHAGVKVKLFTTLEYDLDKADEWIRKNIPALLKPDFKAFEKTIKATKFPDFVMMEKEPRAQVVSDLGKVFGALEEADSRSTEELEAAGRIIDDGQEIVTLHPVTDEQEKIKRLADPNIPINQSEHGINQDNGEVDLDDCPF